jgi:hypothetical protein
MFVMGVVFQKSGPAHELPLFGKDRIDVRGIQAPVLDDDLGKDVLRLSQGQSKGGLQEAGTSPGCPDRRTRRVGS